MGTTFDSISAGMTMSEALAECERRGITHMAWAEDVAAHWDGMFPGKQMPADLVANLARELDEADIIAHGGSDSDEDSWSEDEHERSVHSQHPNAPWAW